MAYPTEITVATGKTAYGGDPEDDQGVTGRQVRVSVTYRLERRDTDLLHVMAVAARELDAAQEVVWHELHTDEVSVKGGQGGLWADRGDEDSPPEDGPHMDDPVVDDPLGGRFHGDDGGRDEEDDEGPDQEEDENQSDNQGDDWPDASPATHQSGSSNGSCNGEANGTASVPGQEAHIHPPVGKTQKLAIEAAARRLGLSDVALAETIRGRYGKTSFTPRYAVDKLNKKEAADLLRALSGLEWDATRSAQLGQPVTA